MNSLFARIARVASNLVARPGVFLFAVLAVVVWAAAGPALHYSDQWQLWINTSTTILTFLMVFLLQNTQNHDTKAIHIKLDELLRAVSDARTEMVDLENMDDAELEKYCTEFKALHLQAAALLEKKTGGRVRPGRAGDLSVPESVLRAADRKTRDG